jgi:hypothetical protein
MSKHIDQPASGGAEAANERGRKVLQGLMTAAQANAEAEADTTTHTTAKKPAAKER